MSPVATVAGSLIGPYDRDTCDKKSAQNKSDKILPSFHGRRGRGSDRKRPPGDDDTRAAPEDDIGMVAVPVDRETYAGASAAPGTSKRLMFSWHLRRYGWYLRLTANPSRRREGPSNKLGMAWGFRVNSTAFLDTCY